MGFDVFGKSGNYFRNNVWGWRPLWHYVSNTCGDILSDNDIRSGSFNDSHRITKGKADKIAKRLQQHIDEGHAQAWVEKYEENRRNTPLVKCDLCNGTGKRDDEFVQGTCNGCHGKGKTEPILTWYPASLENIQEFADFCKESGGFRIS